MNALVIQAISWLVVVLTAMVNTLKSLVYWFYQPCDLHTTKIYAIYQYLMQISTSVKLAMEAVSKCVSTLMVTTDVHVIRDIL